MAKPFAFPEFAALPYQDGSKYLYAFLRCDGVVKIGYTRCPRNRLTDHARHAKHHGQRIVRHAVVHTPGWACDAERELIARMERIARVVSGNEWFGSVSWGAVVTLLGQIAPREFVTVWR